MDAMLDAMNQILDPSVLTDFSAVMNQIGGFIGILKGVLGF